MPLYDRKCSDGHITLDCWEPISAPSVPCKECGKDTERVMLPVTRAVIGDDIPGGVWISHGLCNPDGTPRKYYSKTEMAVEAKRRGLVNVVEHVSMPGSDKSPRTTKWTAISTITEEERLKNWYEHEAKLNQKRN